MAKNYKEIHEEFVKNLDNMKRELEEKYKERDSIGKGWSRRDELDKEIDEQEKLIKLEESREPAIQLDALKYELEEKYKQLEKSPKGFSQADKLIEEIAILENKIASKQVSNSQDKQVVLTEEQKQEISLVLSTAYMFASDLSKVAENKKTLNNAELDFRKLGVAALKNDIIAKYKDVIPFIEELNDDTKNVQEKVVIVKTLEKLGLHYLTKEETNAISDDIKADTVIRLKEIISDEMIKNKKEEFKKHNNKVNENIRKSVETRTIKELREVAAEYRLEVFKELGGNPEKIGIKEDKKIKLKESDQNQVIFEEVDDKIVDSRTPEIEIFNGEVNKNISEAKSIEEAEGIILENAEKIINSVSDENQKMIAKRLVEFDANVLSDGEYKKLNIIQKVKYKRKERTFFKNVAKKEAAEAQKNGVQKEKFSKEKYKEEMEVAREIKTRHDKAFEIRDKIKGIAEINNIVNQCESMEDIEKNKETLITLSEQFGVKKEFIQDKGSNERIPGGKNVSNNMTFPKDALKYLYTQGAIDGNMLSKDGKALERNDLEYVKVNEIEHLINSSMEKIKEPIVDMGAAQEAAEYVKQAKGIEGEIGNMLDVDKVKMKEKEDAYMAKKAADVQADAENTDDLDLDDLDLDDPDLDDPDRGDQDLDDNGLGL